MITIEKINLHREKKDYDARICILNNNLDELANMLHKLSSFEYSYYKTLQFDKRKLSYLLGRISAKEAVKKLSENTLDYQSFYIDTGVFQFPVVKNANQNIQVSISHCDNYGISVAFPEDHPLGIDIERIDNSKVDIIGTTLTDAEKILVRTNFTKVYEGNTLLWTAKEAISKIIKTGFTTDPKVFEVKSIKRKDRLLICEFENFFQYKSISCITNDYVSTLAMPKRTMVDLDKVSAILQSVKI